MSARQVRRLISCSVVASLAACALIAAPDASAGRFALAILRRDGVVLPFASFDGSRWSNSWPAEKAIEVPITLADVPRDWWPDKRAATEWTAQLVSGRRQGITVDAPTVVGVHCTRRVGLRSNYVALEAPPPPQFQPYPKDGLATVGDVQVEPVQLVRAASVEASAFLKSITPDINKAETERVRRWARVWQHPMDDRQRAGITPTLELLARTGGVDGKSNAYYFESIKKYPGFEQSTTRVNPRTLKLESAAEPCNYITFASGWVIIGSNGPVGKPSVGAELTNCNREDVQYVLPLGAIRAAGRLFWIVQASSWDAESYAVVEIKQTEVKPQLSVLGGTCGRTTP